MVKPFDVTRYMSVVNLDFSGEPKLTFRLMMERFIYLFEVATS